MNRYPDWVLDMLDTEGFIERFWYNLSKHNFDTYADIYRITEMEYEHYYGRRKFKNYHSFQVTFSKKYNKINT